MQPRKLFYPALPVLAAAIALTLLSGCASVTGVGTGPQFSEMETVAGASKDKALIFVYSHDLPLGRTFNVWANGQLVSTMMGYGKFFYFYAEPGELHIASKMGGFSGSAGMLALVVNEVNREVQGEKDRIVLPAVAGQAYYLNMHNGFSRERMDLVSNETGLKKIQDCRLANPKAQ